MGAINADNNSGSAGDALAEYGFNGAGRLVVEDFPEPDVKLDYFGGTAGTYAGFDRFGRVVQQLWRDYGASADRDKFTYGYDRNSNRTYRENALTTGKSELYSYDGLNRLAGYDRGDLNGSKDAITNKVRNEAWGYDALGNWSGYKIDADGNGDYNSDGDLDQARANNAVNEITGITRAYGADWATPAYDARGNMTTIPKPADPTTTFAASYDPWNRMVQVKSGASIVAEYQYDVLNRRTAKLLPNGDNWDRTDFYYNAGWQMLEERQAIDAPSPAGGGQGEGATSADPATAVYAQYVWSLRYIDSPVLRDRDADGNASLEERLYYTTDANMNVTALLNTAGDAVERYLYDPYGHCTIVDGSTSGQTEWGLDQDSSSDSDNALNYCGYCLDNSSDLYSVRRRPFAYLLGVWITGDPRGFLDGMNLYQYAQSRPINHTDPYGEFATSTWALAVQCGLNPPPPAASRRH